MVPVRKEIAQASALTKRLTVKVDYTLYSRINVAAWPCSKKRNRIYITQSLRIHREKWLTNYLFDFWFNITLLHACSCNSTPWGAGAGETVPGNFLQLNPCDFRDDSGKLCSIAPHVVIGMDYVITRRNVLQLISLIKHVTQQLPLPSDVGFQTIRSLLLYMYTVATLHV